MLTANHLLIVLALTVAWVVVLLVSPVRRKCSWCKGTRRARKHRWWGRAVACPKCKARGKHARFGAALVHRWKKSIAAEIRQRREGSP